MHNLLSAKHQCTVATMTTSSHFVNSCRNHIASPWRQSWLSSENNIRLRSRVSPRFAKLSLRGNCLKQILSYRKPCFHQLHGHPERIIELTLHLAMEVASTLSGLVLTTI
ncbi:hypothetical protein Ae201684P_015810 [Aphanomyces euteiches]|nr:hypothetical protein Ae201684P_015810 [Aphanomyces euteiches]